MSCIHVLQRPTDYSTKHTLAAGEKVMDLFNILSIVLGDGGCSPWNAWVLFVKSFIEKVVG